MKISVPEPCLVVLMGASGSGKSTFARAHFRPTEILSSDTCRGLVRDDENDQSATDDAFAVLQFIASRRLAAARLTVIDATNVHAESRRPFVQLAREHDVLPVAVVLDLPERLCHARNTARPDRNFGAHVVRTQRRALRMSLRGLEREGFRHVFVLSSEEDVANAVVERSRLWNDRRHEHGPFDIVGDVHGCRRELDALLAKLGYDADTGAHPAGRKVVFLGDLVDRGPDVPGVLRRVMSMVAAGHALCVPGNHDTKLVKKLKGRDVKVAHGLAETLAQLESESDAFRTQVMDFLDGLVSHYVLDDGKLVVAHAGMKAAYQGRASGRVRDFALYGETTGETDEYGLPVRADWASEYRGRAMVVYGHTPVLEPEWLNHTICVDTGCVFGGTLTALRYPEKELVSVPAERVWCAPTRPLRAPDLPSDAITAQQNHDTLLDLADVSGKQLVATRLAGNVTVREENAAAALEAMSRFAVDPRWLVYLPPTMSPCETVPEGPRLEGPAQAFAYYRGEGVRELVCEEKHMGSRAVVIVARDAERARRRFGTPEGESGICYTRTGRRFFDDPALEATLLDHVRHAADRIGLWDELSTDWLCLDCELMPWSVKAQELLRTQYAPVGAAAQASLDSAVACLTRATERVPDLGPLLARTQERASLARQYDAAWRQYCWEVQRPEDLRLAPFHLLASEGAVHTDRDHLWHMEIASRLAAADDGLLVATAHRGVDLEDDASVADAVAWWEALTAQGGEGMVVKPRAFLAKGTRHWVQPAVKCRGPEYLRIIYGLEYSRPENLERLRSRGLGAKRSLAMREFALGVEALERFVRGEPLRHVHQCVFGVLALESEPVDPRL